MNKKNGVISICNALMDILVEVDDQVLEKFQLKKGIMHLVDSGRQKELLDYLHTASSQQPTVELGGSAMNTIRVLSYLGEETGFVGVVGKDAYGEKIQERMKFKGISSHLRLHESEATGTCLVMVSPDGERTMNTCLGASNQYTLDDIPHDEIKNSRIFHFCGYQWFSDTQKEAILSAIHTAKKHDTLVSFDVADPFVVEQNKGDFIEIIEKYADIVFSNQAEAEILLGAPPPEAARALREKTSFAAVKWGSKGAVLAQGKDKQTLVQAEPVQVVDTTGAGDIFASGFLYGFLKGLPLETCGRLATLMAGDVIQRLGVQVSEASLAKARELAQTSS